MGTRIAKLVIIGTIGALALAPAIAGAYSVPGSPGSPGGKPTKPKGGSGTSKSGAADVALEIAGNTGSELANKGSFTVKVKVPTAGVLECKTSSGGTSLGSASGTAKKAGTLSLTVKFSASGIALLERDNGKAIPVTVACEFKPKKGKSSTSTSTVTLDA